ncbi:hypothetical protein BGX34_010145 [Mortierella sp. NVP85]|nr:hypothetical protein BGX34_010145 [Mortierella sp. NVP85]
MLHSGAIRALLTAAALATLLHAQPSDKPPPESTETTAFPLPSNTNAPAVENPASTDAPVPAANIAYASDGKYLYIQGGQKAGNSSNFEFFALDLMANWATNSPKWWPLGNTVMDADARNASGVSGALDHQGRFTVVASNGALFTLQNKRFSRLDAFNNVNGRFKGSGPVIAALPTTGKVYLMGDGQVVDVDGGADPPKPPLSEEQVPMMEPGHAVSWSASKGIMVSTFTTPEGQLGVREYKPGPKAEWITLSTDSKISSRTGHCFVSNLEGTKFYLFGGVSNNNKNEALGETYTYDLGSNTWSHNRAGSPRSKMACAVGQDKLVDQEKLVAQEMLVVWGGYTDGGTTVADNNFPMVFNPASNSWIENFHGAPPTGTSPDSNKGSDSSNVAVIAGAAAGGVALILVVAGLCILRRRRQSSSGKSRGFSSQKAGRKSGEGTMEMGGYTSIPSPFVPDEGYYQQRPGGAHSSPGQSPMSSNPLSSTDQTNSSYQSMPVSVPSTTPISFSAPPLKPRPQSYVAQTSAPTLIQSPFEPDVDLTSQRLAYSAPISAPIPAPAPHPASLPITLSSRPIQMEPYHDRQMGQPEITSGENLTVSARSMEPTTIDLIPITPSEAGEIESHVSRSNSLVSSQAAPSRTKSKPRAFDEPAISRRDSTESLEYLDIA